MPKKKKFLQGNDRDVPRFTCIGRIPSAKDRDLCVRGKGRERKGGGASGDEDFDAQGNKDEDILDANKCNAKDTEDDAAAAADDNQVGRAAEYAARIR
ncbi:hypothetical protein HRG_011569 [Hirsutella rhossiliensis]|uniref:Uncharacterized protein n=1 Tax=Hirsutella rhossiliensis TaxID=111463 RepID=A0A9P8MLA6_9HYPO|nr:uncharacterized protein HRG_11569 [Hirsutella rhossiliensis]KAH0957422.1 hypothetical protein HRG_11569 [Hirsutella rhossiliensis]